MATVPSVDPASLERLLRHERAFVLALGGYAIEIPGAYLVVHERLPVPRMNFVQVVDVPATRQAAFFERALDHYFQRAIRPSFRVSAPVAEHLDRGLRRFGFVPRTEPRRLLVSESVSPPGGNAFVLRPADPGELDLVVDFWSTPGTREEFRRTVEVLWNFPHASELLEPVLALTPEGEPVTAALLYRNHGVTGILAVATQPPTRGQGAASALVRFACQRPIARDSDLTYVPLDHGRGTERVRSLGFRLAATQVEYELPPNAELALPPAGPPSPPRWRPPRRRPEEG